MVAYFRSCSFLLFVLSFTSFAQTAYSGLKLDSYQEEMSRVFPEGDVFREDVFLPRKEGGSSFVGLVARLLGEAPNKRYEGIDVPRYLYKAYKDKKLIGIGHGSSVDFPNGPGNVFVFYGMDQKIKNLRVDNAPELILKELHAGGYIGQFLGYAVEDFEKQVTVTRAHRKRVKGWRKGEFLTTSKKPTKSTLRPYYDKLLRSVRFNAAFMDVAFFITKHPELDEHERISNKAVSGPEVEVKDTKLVTSAEGESSLIIKD